jgi:cellulose synthase/poly-beta-1,6-N-acetylglucosamine synthase-like glycosyltransferase
MMFWIIGIPLFLLLLFYIFLFTWYIRGWEKLSDFSPGTTSSTHFFSIIIPARNEEKNIVSCLKDIVDQDYPPVFYEIIVVNDDSSDNTAKVVDDFISLSDRKNIKLIDAEKPEAKFSAFKKRAIETGIKSSAGEWIITTDADTWRGNKWLSTISSFIAENDPVLISAPVAFHDEQTFFEMVQSLEFCGLIGIGAASIRNKYPNMCNGANLIYKRSVFDEVGGYKGIDHIASGDDELLMHKIFLQYKDKVKFLKSRKAIVTTKAAQTLKEFVHQRKRWAGKGRKYKLKNITIILVLVYLFHLLILAGLIAGIFIDPLFWLAVVSLGLKSFFEAIFLQSVTSFFGKRRLMDYFIPAIPLYLLYINFIGVYANIGTFNWKGRKTK